LAASVRRQLAKNSLPKTACRKQLAENSLPKTACRKQLAENSLAEYDGAFTGYNHDL
jgi:hypothetical protein